MHSTLREGARYGGQVQYQLREGSELRREVCLDWEEKRDGDEPCICLPAQGLCAAQTQRASFALLWVGMVPSGSP